MQGMLKLTQMDAGTSPMIRPGLEKFSETVLETGFLGFTVQLTVNQVLRRNSGPFAED